MTYTAGFPPGKVPFAVNHCVGMLAAIMVLDNLGGGILNPGISSMSINLDDLSQNQSTAVSGTSHAYSGIVKSYLTALFGESTNSANRGLLNFVKDTFQLLLKE